MLFDPLSLSLTLTQRWLPILICHSLGNTIFSRPSFSSLIIGSKCDNRQSSRRATFVIMSVRDGRIFNGSPRREGNAEGMEDTGKNRSALASIDTSHSVLLILFFSRPVGRSDSIMNRFSQWRRKWRKLPLQLSFFPLCSCVLLTMFENAFLIHTLERRLISSW